MRSSAWMHGGRGDSPAAASQSTAGQVGVEQGGLAGRPPRPAVSSLPFLLGVAALSFLATASLLVAQTPIPPPEETVAPGSISVTPLDLNPPDLGTFIPGSLVSRLALPTTVVTGLPVGSLNLPGAGALEDRLYDEALRKANRVARGIENLERCLAIGTDGRPGCDRFQLFQDAICVAAAAVDAPKPENPFSVLRLISPAKFARLSKMFNLFFSPEDPYCAEQSNLADQATLICCKNTPESACTSPPACEGLNDTARALGPCLDLPGGGCFCDYLAECSLGGAVRPTGQAHLVQGWFEDLHEAFRRAIERPSSLGSPSATELLRFATFYGCRGRLEILTEADPFAGVEAIQGQGLAPEVADSMILDLLAQNAAFRVILALPNGPYRFAYVSSRTWTPELRAAYFQDAGFSGQPHVELARHLSPVGRHLLGRTLAGDDMALLAVPAPGEPAEDLDPALDDEDGCELAAAPVIEDLAVAVSGAVADLSFVVRDGEAPRFGGGVYAVDWGDGRIETHAAYVAGRTTSARHTYARNGNFPVHVTATNRAGLSDSERDSASVERGSCRSVAPSAVRVELEAQARRLGGDQGNLTIDLAAADFSGGTTELGREFVGRLRGTRDLGRVSFDHPALDPVRSLRVRPRRWGGRTGGRFIISAVWLVNRSPGLEGTSEVRLPASAITVTGGRFNRTGGNLVLRSEEVYTLNLPGPPEGTNICGQGSGTPPSG